MTRAYFFSTPIGDRQDNISLVRGLAAWLLLAITLAACVPSRTGVPLPSPTPPPSLTLQVLYPAGDSHIAAGEILRFTLLDGSMTFDLAALARRPLSFRAQ